jgi:pimeloyl-ACP methyl ester carboxylesterase
MVLVGSSMGGWLMLLVALALEHRAKKWEPVFGNERCDHKDSPTQIAGLIGIAAAPDFTDWGFTAADKAELAAGRTITRPNAYGPEATPTHARFWADGQGQCLLDGVIALDCPVRLLHGQADRDVPWQISLRLAAALRSDQVQVTLVKDGDHRLSRAEDLALLFANIAGLERKCTVGAS